MVLRDKSDLVRAHKGFPVALRALVAPLLAFLDDTRQYQLVTRLEAGHQRRRATVFGVGRRLAARHYGRNPSETARAEGGEGPAGRGRHEALRAARAIPEWSELSRGVAPDCLRRRSRCGPYFDWEAGCGGGAAPPARRRRHFFDGAAESAQPWSTRHPVLFPRPVDLNSITYRG